MVMADGSFAREDEYYLCENNSHGGLDQNSTGFVTLAKIPVLDSYLGRRSVIAATRALA